MGFSIRQFHGIRRLAPVLVLMAACVCAAAAQDECLKPGRADELKKQIAAAEGAEDVQLSKELVDLGTEVLTIGRDTPPELQKTDQKYNEVLTKARTRICEHLNKATWPAPPAISPEAARAFMYLISKVLPIKVQMELYQVVAEAMRLGRIEKNVSLASYLDRLQVALGHRQLFGTQAFLRDGFVVLAPIERPSRVEERRKEFKMEPLRSYEKLLESTYRMPLIRSVTEPENPEEKPADAAGKTSTTALPNIAADAEGEPVIKIATALVSLDVVVSDPTAATAGPLQKEDFRVLENGKPVAIETFARAESPFDIVLLLDLSGSTAKKTGLIKKSTRSFIEGKRPVDRVAVVSFDDTQVVLSELESDKAKLLERVRNIEGGGGSLVWDSIKFAQGLLDRGSEPGRRKAIVVMTDGADNSLNYNMRIGSKISFADLAESVQRGTASIFPIYLDTEANNAGYYERRVYADARRTLAYLAEQSAGKMYTAKKLEDLTEIYNRVLSDVGTVYSIGFTSPEESSDGKWRTLRVDVPSRPAVKLWHRPGYFPKPAARQ